MRIASISFDGREFYGVITQEDFYMVRLDMTDEFPTIKNVISAQTVKELCNHCDNKAIYLKALAFLTPMPDPEKIICAGMNYHKPYPVEGMEGPDLTNIDIFSHHSKTVIGHGAVLQMPPGKAAESFDFEGGIVAGIGKSGRFIRKKNALENIIGYSIINKGSVRDWMKHSVHAGKNFMLLEAGGHGS